MEYLTIIAQRQWVRAKLHWNKKRTPDGNLNPQKWKKKEMANRKVNITNSINIYLPSFSVYLQI